MMWTMRQPSTARTIQPKGIDVRWIQPIRWQEPKPTWKDFLLTRRCCQQHPRAHCQWCWTQVQSSETSTKWPLTFWNNRAQSPQYFTSPTGANRKQNQFPHRINWALTVLKVIDNNCYKILFCFHNKSKPDPIWWTQLRLVDTGKIPVRWYCLIELVPKWNNWTNRTNWNRYWEARKHRT